MINHEKEIYLIFLLAVDRSWLSIRQASWTRFTIDHSKIQNECKFFIGDGIFSLLVRNPSAASAITMPANGESLLGRSSVAGRSYEIPQICLVALVRVQPAFVMILRWNSKFDQHLHCSGLKCVQSVTIKFCTRHDRNTVVTCTKFRCHQPNMLWTRALQNFIQFRIRSKYR